MAKSKTVGGGAEAYPSGISSFDSEKVFDNRPDGPSNHPTNELNGCRYTKNKMFMGDAVARGEGKYADDVIQRTANGDARSRGKNIDQQRNWSPASAWSEDEPWGGNLTGM